MTLRRKFGLLLATVFVIPFLVAALVGFLSLESLRRDERIRETFPLNRFTVESIRRSLDGSTRSPLPRNVPTGRYVLIRRSDRRVIQSAVEAFPVGATADMEAIESYFAAELEGEKLVTEFIRDDGGEEHALVYPVWLDIESFVTQFHRTRVPLVGFMIILAAGTAVGAVFLNRTARSILLLQEATRKMAEGDMEFRLPEVGADEIRNLTRSFVQMRLRLKEEARSRARFLMAVSHDLATPLTSIEGYVEAIRDGFADDDPERLGRYLDIIHQKSQILGARVESLIESARMETGEWSLKHEEVGLKEYLDRTAAMFREDALVAGREFSYIANVDPTIVVRMDPVLVTRALENLFSNALRYTAADDGIVLRADAPSLAERAVLVVEDRGRGIPPEELEHVFDPFYRGAAFSRGGGYGIGLSTVHHIITSHGWSIHVDSSPGEGTAVSVSIPLGREQAEA